jgi:hypothetical protein
MFQYRRAVYDRLDPDTWLVGANTSQQIAVSIFK